MMAGREAFGISAAVHPPAATMQAMRLAFTSEGTPVYKPVTATALEYSPALAGGGEAAAAAAATQTQGTQGVAGQGGNGAAGDQVKRKRGRPRKYGPDGGMALGLSPASPPAAASAPSSAGSGLPSPTDASAKKVRGRPPGSGRKQQMAALGSAGVGFTPHIITVKAGEDVSSKIMSFSQKGPRAICILSANGALSNVTLRQAASSGGTVTLEGRYEILSLSGSFLLSESGGQRSRTGGLSVSLAGSDGRVLGGGVAGLLTAASPVQVVVGSFLPEGRKDSKSHFSRDPSSATPKVISSGRNTGAGSPPSRGTLSESSGGAGSPINQNTGAYNNNNNSHGLGSMPWN